MTTVNTAAKLPNFLIIGGPRCGTSFLHRCLSAHPDVFTPKVKELHFFDRNDRFNRGVGAYSDLFQLWNGQTAVGEATPAYLMRGIVRDRNGQHRFDEENDCAMRIAATLPDVKIIVSLRDPVQRAYSEYWANRMKGREDQERFQDAAQLEWDTLRAPESSSRCYLYRSCYADHLQHWLRFFPQQQMRIVIYEQWREDPRAVITELFRFIDVAPGLPITLPPRENQGWTNRVQWLTRVQRRVPLRIPGMQALDRWNRQRGYPPLDRATYATVRSRFTDQIERLSRLAKVDADLQTLWSGSDD